MTSAAEVNPIVIKGGGVVFKSESIATREAVLALILYCGKDIYASQCACIAYLFGTV